MHVEITVKDPKQDKEIRDPDTIKKKVFKLFFPPDHHHFFSIFSILQ